AICLTHDREREHWSRHLKIHPALVIDLHRGGKIEVVEWNFLRSLLVEHPKHSTRDRVIANFLLMLIAEDKHSRRRYCCMFFLARRWPLRIRILISFSVPILTLAQPLLVEVLCVHLIGKRLFAFSVLVIVVGRRRAPPPVGIVVACVAVSGVPRISVAPAAAVAVMKTTRAN